jgi:ATP-dependent DNA helicase DinG
MSWSEAEAQFALTLPGYESRDQQRRLATEIEQALAAQVTIMAQAGTGTGKSLALLVPAIDYALDQGLPVIIATATKALQDQYAGKDLPFLQEHLGKPFTWSVLKGRGNYACLSKINALTPADEVFNLAPLMEELSTGEHTGDLDDLVTDIDPRDRPKLTSSSEECPGKYDCPFGTVCFAEKAKKKAKESDVVVVNHALLVTDLVVRSKGNVDSNGDPIGMLPTYCAVGVDEAHELEEYATSMLGETFSQRSIIKLAAEVANFTKKTDTTALLTGAVGTLFHRLEGILAEAGKDKRNVRVTGEDLLTLETPITAVLNTLREMWLAVNGVTTRGDDGATGRQKRLKKRIGGMGEKLTNLLVADDSQLVRWVENDEKRGVVLSYAPLHVGPFLRRWLWEEVPGALLSATLAFGNDFGYITERLGIDEFRSFDAGTPFDYPKQSALFVPGDMDPSPASRARWSAMAPIVTEKLVKAAGGRALLLFTSKVAMNACHAAIAGNLAAEGIRILKQGDRPNRVLAEEFKSDETSVLFALRSFMTGVDVQGDALRLVVIDKLPFPVPTDVIWAARCDAVDAVATNTWRDGSFPKLTVPAMALTLLQAFGRLIRTRQDRGMVAILDSRLLTKAYGKKMLKAMPDARRVTTLAEATQYLEDLDG